MKGEVSGGRMEKAYAVRLLASVVKDHLFRICIHTGKRFAAVCRYLMSTLNVASLRARG